MTLNLASTPGLVYHQLGQNSSGAPVIHAAGNGDPNSSTDSLITSAAVGSLYSRLDAPDSTHALYVKTAALNNVWTNK